MNLSGLLPIIKEAPSLVGAIEVIGREKTVTLGLADSAKAATLAALLRDFPAPALILVSRSDRADALAEELAVWLGQPDRIIIFPERDPLPYERLAPDPEAVRGRLRVLSLLSAEKSVIVVASVKAVAQRTLSPQELWSASYSVAVGDALEPQQFIAQLSALGYNLEPLVERPGQVSRRGGIIDLFPSQAEMPARIELLGRRVESLRPFDPATQRSQRASDSLILGPAREVILPSSQAETLAKALDLSTCSTQARQKFEEELSRLASPVGFDTDYYYVPFLAKANLFEHLPPRALAICDEYADLAAAQEELHEQALASRQELEEKGEIPRGLPLPYTPWREVTAALEAHERRLYLARWATGDEQDTIRPPFSPATAYGGQLRRLVAEAASSLRDGRHIVIVSQQAQRLSELLADEGLSAQVSSGVAALPAQTIGESFTGISLVQGSLPGGWYLNEGGVDFSLITDSEIFGFTKQRRALPRRAISRDAFLSQISPGDYLVHVEHGIARFVGLVRLEIDGREREYLELHYAEDDRLFVPNDQLDRLSRYAGPSDQEPRLTRLGSGEWQRTKARVRKAVHDLARELLALYAAREVVSGYVYPLDTPWQMELEASFPYVETADQMAAIAEVKRDMEMSRPMDRLVCGDVGYGKTEVAIRAAFKATLAGRQVAVLVPTTVLAQQHYETFRQRLAAFPVRIEMLSRFRSDSQQKEIIDGLAKGAIDIVIGTHRLLQKDVTFKDLGLVVIDEEQRFGVMHKEYLKKMRKEVDVLTLSATPIPRTLYMAMGGIRDMSTMETPPEERLPIKTYVAEYDERLVREAILRERERGGQVYFVHNRIHNIDYIVRKLQDIVPEATMAVAHGRMPEQKLEQVMLDFMAGEIDVLVCTTIIESGLDIPNVNTIIINQADKMGLGQLYQLRGRVGRGAHRAYAYLFYDRKARLTEAAQKRLQTIFEATELGAGFQIALRDLEIRGAGNLLGAEQSGHIAAVGFDLYCGLLAEAAERLRALQHGEMPPRQRDAAITIDLPLSAHIPESYVPDLNLRLALYQRMSDIHKPEDLSALEQELIDRFGPVPPVVRDLLYVVGLRTLALAAEVRSIALEDGQIVLRLNEGEAVPPEAFAEGVPRGVHVGRTLLRIEITTADAWRKLLQEVLKMLVKQAVKV